jgi:hypothetical protein
MTTAIILTSVLSIHPNLDREVFSSINGTSITHIERSDGQSTGPVLFSAPFQYGCSWYENLGPNFLNSFASAGMDVWCVDDPSRGWMAPGTCEAGVVDCSHLSSVTIEDVGAHLNDVRVDYLEPRWGGVRPVIGGFVGGSIFALEAIEQDPTAYSGALLWNGTLQASGPAHRAYASAFCGAFAPLVGLVPWDPSAAVLLDAIRRGRDFPNDPSPYVGLIPGYDPGSTNRTGMLRAITQHHDGPSWATPDFFFFTGSIDGLKYADMNRFFGIPEIGSNYGSITMVADLFCKMSMEQAYENLGDFDGHILSVGSTGGFSAQLDVTMNAFTGAASVLESYGTAGESDLYFSPYRQLLADLPMAAWAKLVLIQEAYIE